MVNNPENQALISGGDTLMGVVGRAMIVHVVMSPFPAIVANESL